MHIRCKWELIASQRHMMTPASQSARQSVWGDWSNKLIAPINWVGRVWSRRTSPSGVPRFGSCCHPRSGCRPNATHTSHQCRNGTECRRPSTGVSRIRNPGSSVARSSGDGCGPWLIHRGVSPVWRFSGHRSAHC
jgi:hypothetical protein